MSTAEEGATNAHGAVIATSPPKRPLHVIAMSGRAVEAAGDVDVRRHYYEVETASGERMTIYFDRNPTGGGRRKQRWWLYTIEE